jgi:hypothetical protein
MDSYDREGVAQNRKVGGQAGAAACKGAHISRKHREGEQSFFDEFQQYFYLGGAATDRRPTPTGRVNLILSCV